MRGCQKGGVMMEIGQNDGGGDRREWWEYDIAHTQKVTSNRSRYIKNLECNITLKVN